VRLVANPGMLGARARPSALAEDADEPTAPVGGGAR
jgi:hypothetical protein